MKKVCLFIAGMLFCFVSFAQVGIGTVSPDPGSILDLSSSTKGFLAPRVGDHTQVTPVTDGLLVYNTSSKTFWYYKSGTGWTEITNYWGRTLGSPNYTFLLNTTDKLCIGTTNTTEKFNIDGNIFFTRGTPGNPRRITVQGQSTTSSDGSDLKISAGGGSSQSSAANLYLDGGEDNFNNMDGNVIIASQSNYGKIGIRTLTPTSTLTINGSVGYNVSSHTGNYTVTENDRVILCTGDVTATLPSAGGYPGRELTFKRTYRISLDKTSIIAVAGQTIDGEPTYDLTDQYQYVTIISDGSNWNIIANN